MANGCRTGGWSYLGDSRRRHGESCARSNGRHREPEELRGRVNAAKVQILHTREPVEAARESESREGNGRERGEH